jgi:hypothetical protein
MPSTRTLVLAFAVLEALLIGGAILAVLSR